jgi:hypothetical protein
MSADLTKRIMVRVTDEQLAWIGEMAADEGMDNATFVRVVLDRLSKGRAPLIGMMQPTTQALSLPVGFDHRPGAANYTESLDDGAVPQTLDILAQRAAEAEANLPPPQDAESDHPEESAAIPLRRVARERYNPGRQ